MRKSPGRPRTPSRLSASLDQRLNFYALAASAAGVSLLALAQPSEAKIVYTKTHQVIGTNGIYPIDLNHDGIIDFLIQERAYFGSSSYTGAWAKEAFGNAVEANWGAASALTRGAVIGLQEGFFSSKGSFGEVMVDGGCNIDRSCWSWGQWWNVHDRYLGLKFQIGRKIHYGWARLSLDVGNGKITTTLTGYAYETTPDKPILAGQTHSATDDGTSSGLTGTDIPSSVPTTAQATTSAAQPESLGQLALGTHRTSLWRRP